MIEFHTDLTNLTNCASLRPRLSALPPTRMSVGCDERNFSSSEECSLLLNSAGWRTRALASALREICEICVKIKHLQEESLLKHKSLRHIFSAIS